MRVFWLLKLVAVNQILADVSSPSTISRIAFGSCNKENRPQPIWESIVKTKPDVFIWLGDAIYADEATGVPGFRSPVPIPAMREKYATQTANPNYQSMLSQVPHVLGTWDDHDYGMNNGNQQYVDRAASKDLFLDFLQEPKDSPRRSRPGMHQAHTFGPPGQRVTIILLDVRYFKDDDKARLLGETQWEWLEHTLQTHDDSQLYLIGSGIQVLSVDRPVPGEKWQAYPHDRQRLLDTIRVANLTGVVSLLSGDVHFAELNCVEAGLSHPLLEATSSGLTHAWGETGEFKFINKFVSYIGSFLLYVLPVRYQLDTIAYQRNISQVHGLNYYTMLNFGTVNVDWKNRNVTLGIHGLDGSVVFDHTFSFNKSAFQSEHVTCTPINNFRDWIGPNLSRAIILGLLAVACTDFWLLLYLFYLLASWLCVRSDEPAPGPARRKAKRA